MRKIQQRMEKFTKKDIFNKTNIPMFIAAAWAFSYVIVMLVTKNAVVESVNTYFLIAVCFFVTAQTLIQSNKDRSNYLLLYGVLGLSCLALGNLYYVVLSIVSKVPDYVSIGKFSLVCCFLFFLAALSGLKANHTKKSKIIYTAVNIISIIATITVACAVIINNEIVLNVSILLLDSLCIILSVSLLRTVGARFFASVMLALTATDIISGLIFVPIINLIISAIIPILYLLLGRSLITLKAGKQNDNESCNGQESRDGQ